MNFVRLLKTWSRTSKYPPENREDVSFLPKMKTHPPTLVIQSFPAELMSLWGNGLEVQYK